jgi:hypothetical protein
MWAADGSLRCLEGQVMPWRAAPIYFAICRHPAARYASMLTWLRVVRASLRAIG